MPKYFFTIITSNLNSGDALAATARSIKDQTFSNIQWIIADGASRDNSIALLKDIDTPNMELTSEPDTGIYNAWNKSLSKAQGEWVLFLGAGDTFNDRDVLQDVFNWIENNTSKNDTICYGSVLKVSRPEDMTGILDNQKWQGLDAPWILGRPSLPCHQGVFHRASLLTGKAYNEKLRIAADSIIVLRELIDGHGKDMDILAIKMLAGGISDNKKYRAVLISEIIKVNWQLGIFFRHPILQILLLIVSWVKYSLLGKA